jgi:inorganic pyrophosphatase
MRPKLYELDPGERCPEIVRMIVEIPRHSSNKYEYDNELGVFRLDRTLYSPMLYPGDYGFIPGTVTYPPAKPEALETVSRSKRLGGGR